MSVPKEMTCVHLTSPLKLLPVDKDVYKQSLTTTTVPVPVPKNGQVLIKVERAAINPSDLGTLAATYGDKAIEFPLIPGLEGSGTVVSSGGGILGWTLMNQRVAFASKGGGAWAEYVVVNDKHCFGLPGNVNFDIGANSIVNPMTALSFLEITQKANLKCLIHTAAASALGKMLIRLCQKNGVRVLAVVRKDTQVEELKAIGCENVFNSSDEDFAAKLSAACKEYKCRIAFDAVAGELTGTLVSCLIPNSTVYVYGMLANKPISGITGADLIFKNKAVKGFWLSQYLPSKNLLAMLMFQSKGASYLSSGELQSKVREVLPFDQAADALAMYCSDMGQGKVLLCPPKKEEVAEEKKEEVVEEKKEEVAEEEKEEPAEAVVEEKKEVAQAVAEEKEEEVAEVAAEEEEVKEEAPQETEEN